MDPTIESIELLAPFLPREQIIELCSGRKALEAWRQEKINRHRWRYQVAWWRQRQMARRNAGRQMRFVDGLGAHRITIDDELAAWCRLRYGRQCLSDPDFRARLEKDHPEVRVPSPPRRLHHVNGLKDLRSEGSTSRYGARPELPTDSAGNRENPGRESLIASHETAAAPILTP